MNVEEVDQFLFDLKSGRICLGFRTIQCVVIHDLLHYTTETWKCLVMEALQILLYNAGLAL